MSNTPLPFPTSVTQSRDQIEQQYWRCLDTRAADPSYHFNLVIPRTWRPLDLPVTLPVAGGGLTSLATFHGVTLIDAEVEVGACLLPREITPADWLDIHLEGLGLEVVERRVIDGEGGEVADILTASPAATGEPMVARWLALKNYDRMFLLQGRARAPDYVTEAEVLLVALTNFTLVAPIDWALAERLRTYSRRVPGDFLLMYPESWELTEDPASSERALLVSLVQRAQGVAVGRMAFAAVARAAESDPQVLASRFADDLRRAGVTTPDVALVPGAPQPGFERTWTAITTGMRDTTPMEARVWIGARPDAWLFLGVVGPSRAAHATVWAVNTRAFVVAVRQLKVP